MLLKQTRANLKTTVLLRGQLDRLRDRIYLRYPDSIKLCANTLGHTVQDYGELTITELRKCIKSHKEHGKETGKLSM